MKFPSVTKFESRTKGSVLENLEAIPAGARIALYGAGTKGAFLLQLLRAEREDVTVLYFLDSMSRGQKESLPVLLPEDVKSGDALFPEMILITSSFETPILAKLESLGFENYRLIAESYLEKIKNFASEYVDWLYSINSGFINRGHLYCFDYVMRHLPSDAPILEIGSFCGLSANLISYYKQKHRKKNLLITCDRWEFEGAANGLIGDSTVTYEAYRQFARESFKRNVSFFSQNDLPFTVALLSDDFFAAWKSKQSPDDIFGRKISLGGPISFCFVDGNHRYEFVRRDFENTDAFLEPGGFILFDDSADGSGWEVCRLIDEIKKDARYEVVLQNPHYLFRKKKE